MIRKTDMVATACDSFSRHVEQDIIHQLQVVAGKCKVSRD